MDWKLNGVSRDLMSVTSDWEIINNDLIEGVRVKEIKNVVKDNGYLTELWRKDWNLDELDIEQVFQNVLYPSERSGWHAHERTTDRIIVNWGVLKIILFDSRKESPSYNKINEFRCGSLRPMLLVIPPQVFHAVQNTSDQPASLINLVDKAYDYQNPDHWRLPIDSDQIPYHW